MTLKRLTLTRISTGHYKVGEFEICLLEQTATTWEVRLRGRVVCHKDRLLDARDWCRREMGKAA